MRHLIFGLFALFICNTDYQATGIATLGRQGTDCAGRGICGFSLAGEAEANVQFTYTPADTLLTVAISREKLSATEMMKQFGVKNPMAPLPASTLFVMEEPYVISPQLKASLNIQSFITGINPGNYTIAQTAALIVVSFKLQ